MTIRPYAPRSLPRPHHEVAAVGLDLRARYTDGSTRHVHNPRPNTCYYLRTEHARELNRDRHLGALRLYEGRPYEWRYQGRTHYLIRDLPRDPEAAALALGAWRDWIEAAGAEVAGIRRTSRSLLRATLRRPVPTSAGEVPPLTEVVGGRVQAFTPPAELTDVIGVDLQAAYARTLGTLPWGGWWYDVSPGLYPEDEEGSVFHEATVSVPPQGSYGPLPHRGSEAEVRGRDRIARWWGNQDRDYPTGVVMRQVWAEPELREAIALGCDVTIHRTWYMPPTRQPFEPWWRQVVAGRSLRGPAGRLAKLTGNVLWGSFLAGGGTRTEVYDDHGTMREREVPIPGRIPEGLSDLPLGETVTAAIRAKLGRDVIHRNSRRVLSVHTDGAILAGHRMPSGLSALGWRVKYRATRMTYLGPQTYAYRTGRGPWTFVLGGIPTADAPEVFWPLAREMLPVKRAHR